MDALELQLPDGSFDVSASQLGVTVVPDLKRGLGEMVRVTKPGGKMLIAALGPPQKAEFFGLFLAALTATVPGFTGPPTNPPRRSSRSPIRRGSMSGWPKRDWVTSRWNRSPSVSMLRPLHTCGAL